MYEIGRIKLVQVQRHSLKRGERPKRYYDPSPLTKVETLQLTPEGCIGLMPDGERIVDKHHSEHPDSNNIGSNGVSFSFTGHYQTMRTRFGTHLLDACAGENILIESDRVYQLPELGQRIIIESATTGEKTRLCEIEAAVPCVQFSCYSIDGGRTAYNPEIASQDIKAALQFLQHGMRGFYVTLEDGQHKTQVQTGDRVFVDTNNR